MALLYGCAQTPRQPPASAPVLATNPSKTEEPLAAKSSGQSPSAAAPQAPSPASSSPNAGAKPSSNSTETATPSSPTAKEGVAATATDAGLTNQDGDGTGRTQTGIASWYGPGFQGRRTANGERFDTNQLTAAHKTLPFGTRVRVRSLVNGKEVVVRINDRGPFIAGRIIDLSRAAAQAIGMSGVKRVVIETLK
jgi:rare lipoprotein A